MAMIFLSLFIILLYFLSSSLSSVTSCDSNTASECDYDFRIFCCGVYGGAYASSLTSFLLSETTDPYNFLSMDVGTSLDCLKIANDNGQLSIILDEEKQESENLYTPIGHFRKKQLNGFLVSHSHLDHVGGLILSSPDDSFTAKPIISRPIVIDQFLALFQPPLWPSYGIFGYYNISINESNNFFTELNEYTFKIQTFALAHTVPSTAFLLCNSNETLCILFLGDTGPDPVEHSDNLSNLWMSVAPLIVKGKLGAIFMECSYDNSQPDASLFGHLNPNWILRELYVLSGYVAQEMGSDDVLNVLSDLDVVIIHIKPTFVVHKDTERSRELIESELSNPVNQSYSSMGVNFVIPKQTDMIYVKAGKPMGHFALNSSDISKTFSLYIFAIVLNVLLFHL